MSLEVPGCTDPKAASCYWSFSQHKAEGGSLAEEQAFPLVAVHFPLSWSWQWPWSWRACRACFPLPYLSSFLICVITALHLPASQLPSALQHEKWTERLSKEYGPLHHIIPSQRGHLKVVMLLIKTLPSCSLAHLWSSKFVGWAVTLKYLQNSDTDSPQCGPS